MTNGRFRHAFKLSVHMHPNFLESCRKKIYFPPDSLKNAKAEFDMLFESVSIIA